MQTISCLKLELKDYQLRSPREVLKEVWPKGFRRRAWWPIYKHLYVLFDFNTVVEREQWEAALPAHLHACLDTEAIEWLDDYDWTIRDRFGYVIKRFKE